MAATLLKNCRVFDGHGDEAVPGLDVLVVGNTIEAVSEKPIQDRAATVIDVGGRTVLPGLIDAHVHVFAISLSAARNETVPLTLMTARAVPRIRAMLDRGFTTVRDVAGGDVGIRDAVEQGFIAGPRLFVGGPGLTQTGGHGDHRRRTDSRYDIDYNANAFVFFSRIVDGVDEMRRAVRDELRKGADHIKIMASGGVGSPSDALENVQFSAEELRVAVTEAASRGKYVCAHTYTSEAIRHAVEAGIRTVEHANFIDAATAEIVAARSAFVVPTLVCYEVTAQHGEKLGLSPFVMDKLAGVNRAGVEMLGICRTAGARMGFGTDLMGEMEYAQSYEFTIRGRVERPVDVLKSATTVNAEILQQAGRLGEIRPGALADIIVCDGDPLRDITLLSEPEKNLRMIMKDGAVHKSDLPASGPS
jgi:imidazolonepropionase-like amidohydrolase